MSMQNTLSCFFCQRNDSPENLIGPFVNYELCEEIYIHEDCFNYNDLNMENVKFENVTE